MHVLSSSSPPANEIIRPSWSSLVFLPPTRQTGMVTAVDATPLPLVCWPPIAALLQLAPPRTTTIVIVADIMSSSPLRVPKSAGSAPCGLSPQGRATVITTRRGI